ncbi:MAG: hypothetical protein RLZZ399_833 [Verrucomicrobiota bacterium]
MKGDASALALRAVDFEGGVDLFCSFAHVHQAEVAEAEGVESGGVESDAIVLDGKGEGFGMVAESDCNRLSLSVFSGV